MNALPDHDPACPFCRNLAGNPRCAFVSQSDIVSSFVNPRQYRPGALLVIPNRHVVTVFDMTAAEWSAVCHRGPTPRSRRVRRLRGTRREHLPQHGT